MLNRQGFVAVGAGIMSIVAARVFGILELFIIGAGFLAAAAVALAIVWVRRPRLRAGRWIHPAVLVAGDVGRVDLRIEHLGSVRSSEFTLSEEVRRPRSAAYIARLPVAPMASGGFTSTGYQLMAAGRGIVRLGPLVVENRDPLGMARARTRLLDVDEVFVAPRSYLLDMPQLGQGVLGAQLLAMARRLGPGEFHGLREYVDGDEPRSIHWKASARSEQLLVKEHTTEGSAPLHDRARRAGPRSTATRTGSSERSPPRRASSTAPTGRGCRRDSSRRDGDRPARSRRRRQHAAPARRDRTVGRAARCRSTTIPAKVSGC